MPQTHRDPHHRAARPKLPNRGALRRTVRPQRMPSRTPPLSSRIDRAPGTMCHPERRTARERNRRMQASDWTFPPSRRTPRPRHRIHRSTPSTRHRNRPHRILPQDGTHRSTARTCRHHHWAAAMHRNHEHPSSPHPPDPRHHCPDRGTSLPGPRPSRSAPGWSRRRRTGPRPVSPSWRTVCGGTPGCAPTGTPAVRWVRSGQARGRCAGSAPFRARHRSRMTGCGTDAARHPNPVAASGRRSGRTLATPRSASAVNRSTGMYRRSA